MTRHPGLNRVAGKSFNIFNWSAAGGSFASLKLVSLVVRWGGT